MSNGKYPGLLVSQADKEQALYQGLLGLGSQLSQGYSSTPVSFMQRLGQAGQGFQKGYQGQIARTKQDQLEQMQAQSQQAQMEAQRMKIEEAKRLEQERIQKEKIAREFGLEQMQGAPTGYGVGMVDPGLAQAAAPANMAKMDPMEAAMFKSNPTAWMENKRATQVSAAARKTDRAEALADKIAFEPHRRFAPPAQTNVYTGAEISKDYMPVRDDSGNIISASPIPGGKEDPAVIKEKKDAERAAALYSKQKEAMPGIRASIMTKHDRLPILKSNIEDIKELSKGFWTSGTLGQALGPFAHTDQYALESKMNNIKAAFGLQELIDIKAAGGTFGALSENEMTLLISSVQTLDPNLGPEDLGQALDDAVRLYEKGLSTSKSDFKEMYPDVQAPWGAVRIKGDKDPAYLKLRPGDQYIGPDNVPRIR